MAQKAVKSLATRNAAALKRIHLSALGIHLSFILLRLSAMRSSVTSRTVLLYIILSLPSLAIELFFEMNSRPKHNPAGDVTRAGDDLEAKGLTEYLFDVMYWTWGTTIAVIVLGDRAWWIWAVVPIYSVWAANKAFGSVKDSISGMAGPAKEPGPLSNRQKKLDKRGGQWAQQR